MQVIHRTAENILPIIFSLRLFAAALSCFLFSKRFHVFPPSLFLVYKNITVPNYFLIDILVL